MPGAEIIFARMKVNRVALRFPVRDGYLCGRVGRALHSFRYYKKVRSLAFRGRPLKESGVKHRVPTISCVSLALAGCFAVFGQALAAEAVSASPVPLLMAQAGGANTPIPPVIDRPLDANAGPRVAVSRFEVEVQGAESPAWVEGGYLGLVERKLEAARAGQPANGFTIPMLEQITNDIATELREGGMVLAQVFVPAQAVRGGVVKVQVLPGRLGRVIAEGNSRYSSTRLMTPFQELVGAPVDKDDVESALLYLTDYPGLVVFGVFGEGGQIGDTDLSLKVQEERAATSSVSADNYGSEFTGEIRAMVDFAWNNPSGAGDLLSAGLQQTANPANGTYGAVEYQRPVFGHRNTVGIGYSVNTFDVAQQIATNPDTEGDTDVLSFFFQRSFVRSRNFNLSGRVALDLEDAEVTLLGDVAGKDELTVLRIEGATDFIDTRFRGINQATLGYHRGFDDFLGSMDKTGNDGESIRTGGSGEFSGGEFDKWVATFSRLQKLTDNSSLLFRAELQQSDDLLASLEQFSLGGPDSVRAYSPAEVLTDSGGFLSLELILNAPGFSDRPAFGNRTWGEVFQVSVYADYAGGRNSDPDAASGEFKTDDISGVGIGLQFNMPGKFLGRLDVATPLSDRDAANGNDPQYYARVNYSF